MFVAEKLIYVQMEKTASTHIAHVLADLVGGEQLVQHIHLTRADFGGRLPVDTEGRVVVGSIRNPWSWYLSLWAYGCRGGGGRFGTYHRLTAAPPTVKDMARAAVRYTRAKRKLPGPVIRDLREEAARQRRVRTELWRPLYLDVDDVGAFREWMRLVYEPASASELFPQFGRTPLRFHSGFMTFRYFWNFARDRGRLMQDGVVDTPEQLVDFERSDSLIDDVIVVEHLEQDLARVLEKAGYDLDAVRVERLRELSSVRTNESPHRSARDYFDDATASLVAQRDRFLVDRFELTPPW